MAKTTAAAAAQAQPREADLNRLVRLHHDDAAGCSYGGREYPVDQNGDVLVPAKAAADLTAHGFVPAPEGDLRRQAGTAKRRRRPTAPGAKAAGGAARGEG